VWRDIAINDGDVEHPHRHDYLQCMFLEKVSGLHQIDFMDYKAKSNCLHFVGRGRVHEVGFESDVQGCVFLFPESLFGSDYEQKLLSSFLFFKAEAHPILELSVAQFKECMLLVEQTKEAIAQEQFDVSKYLFLALLSKVRDLYQLKHEHIEKKMPSEIIQFNDLLKKKGCEWTQLNQFLEVIGVSSGRLNALCKEVYGRTALQRLQGRKMLEAKRMLVYSEKQVKEVAYDCGFEDVAYFNRFFKKHAACTPSQFRKNH